MSQNYMAIWLHNGISNKLKINKFNRKDGAEKVFIKQFLTLERHPLELLITGKFESLLLLKNHKFNKYIFSLVKVISGKEIITLNTGINSITVLHLNSEERRQAHV